MLLREFSFGHARQLESVLREHLVGHSELLAGIQGQAFIDIDSLLRPVYGHAKQGASYGHTKIAGKQVLPKGAFPAGHRDQHRAHRGAGLLGIGQQLVLLSDPPGRLPWAWDPARPAHGSSRSRPKRSILRSARPP